MNETAKQLKFGDGSNAVSVVIMPDDKPILFIEPGKGTHKVGERVYEPGAEVVIPPIDELDASLIMRFSNTDSIDALIGELQNLRKLVAKAVEEAQQEAK